MKIEITEVEADVLEDAIINNSLRWHLETLKAELKSNRKGSHNMIFSTNRKEDRKLLKKAIKHFEFVAEYYGA